MQMERRERLRRLLAAQEAELAEAPAVGQIEVTKVTTAQVGQGRWGTYSLDLKSHVLVSMGVSVGLHSKCCLSSSYQVAATTVYLLVVLVLKQG
jgi:hypothetical protein